MWQKASATLLMLHCDMQYTCHRHHRGAPAWTDLEGTMNVHVRRITCRQVWQTHRDGVVFVLCLGFFRTAVADWNPVPSGSMRPTILEGDVVLINRLAYDVKLPLTDVSVTRTGEPQRGDSVTFHSPKDDTRLIKPPRRAAGPPARRAALRPVRPRARLRPADRAARQLFHAR